MLSSNSPATAGPLTSELFPTQSDHWCTNDNTVMFFSVLWTETTSVTRRRRCTSGWTVDENWGWSTMLSCVYKVTEEWIRDSVCVCVCVLLYCKWIMSVLDHSPTSSSDLFGSNPAPPVLYVHCSSEIRYTLLPNHIIAHVMITTPLTNQLFNWQLGEEGVTVFKLTSGDKHWLNYCISWSNYDNPWLKPLLCCRESSLSLRIVACLKTC